MSNSAKAKSQSAEGRPFDVVRTIIEALLIAIVFRTVLYQPFVIPSGSMEPTLLVGDYLFVSKYSYGYSRYSLPFSPPLFSGRIFGGAPQRGDIVVFRLGSTDFIKRIVGLPGDRIQVTDGTLMINGTAVARQPESDFVGHNPCPGPVAPDSPPVHVKRWRETLPNGVSYDTLECGLSPGLPDNTGVYTVPPDHFFMMGDNRENSDDSRLGLGYVPYENLIGRAQLIFFSISGDKSAWEIWDWPAYVRWSRLLTLVR